MDITLTEEQVDAMANVLEVLDDVFRTLSEMISELKDKMEFLLNDIRDHYGYSTSCRYKFVKYLSKLGYNKYEMWVNTQYARLARSNC